MNKYKFNNLKILEQIDYINNQLKNNNSITSVCKELGVGRSTIRDRFKKVNYIYSKDCNSYIYNKSITDVVQPNLEATNRRSTSDMTVLYNDSITDVMPKDTIAEIITKSDKEIKKTLLDLVNNYDVLKDIIELHRRNTSVIKQQILIDLDDSENKLTTLRVNKKVLEQFDQFCDNNKQYKKVDLLSQALKDFISNHS